MATLDEYRAADPDWLDKPETWPTVIVQCSRDDCTNKGISISIRIPGDDQKVICGGEILDADGNLLSSCGTVLRG